MYQSDSSCATAGWDGREFGVLTSNSLVSTSNLRTAARATTTTSVAKKRRLLRDMSALLTQDHVLCSEYPRSPEQIIVSSPSHPLAPIRISWCCGNVRNREIPIFKQAKAHYAKLQQLRCSSVELRVGRTPNDAGEKSRSGKSLGRVVGIPNKWYSRPGSGKLVLGARIPRCWRVYQD